MRRLLVRYRSVPSHSLEYASLWNALERAVTAAGGHAWHFRNATEPARLIEFVEFPSELDIVGVPAVAAADEALEILSPSTASELWDEWRH
jgi:hypothetical protein